MSQRPNLKNYFTNKSFFISYESFQQCLDKKVVPHEDNDPHCPLLDVSLTTTSTCEASVCDSWINQYPGRKHICATTHLFEVKGHVYSLRVMTTFSFWQHKNIAPPVDKWWTAARCQNDQSSGQSRHLQPPDLKVSLLLLTLYVQFMFYEIKWHHWTHRTKPTTTLNAPEWSDERCKHEEAQTQPFTSSSANFSRRCFLH